MDNSIIVVDDEQDVVTYLSTIFRDNGFRVIAATSGEEGLELARRDRPDLVCLDISMPAPSGVRVYRELREDPDLKSIPVVMVTGVTQQFEQFIKTRKQVPPPDGYISKPFEPDALLATVRGLLGETASAR